MEFEKDVNVNGFVFKKKEFVNEINSEALIFEHEKTGAKLLKLQNDDDNKVFSISFRTPPYDNTGLPHILEHSVLCGSRKFNTKEPFVELIKGSLNTFLNAMTFPDKTMYPVASKNEKDFFNLMDVYLDAVLYPNIHRNPMILMQEGWHYEIEDKNAPLSIKGVVFNEMKGAFSAPERVLFTNMDKVLYPDTAYGFESGGIPENIPELTQEKFADFHKKYYHPSNSYIFIYGNGNTEKELEFINKNYLNDFEKISVDSKLTIQKDFSERKYVKNSYPVSEDESLEGKTFLGLGFSAGNSTDSEFYHAMQVIRYMLFDNPAAPLKNRLLRENLGKDVFGIVNEIMKPMIGIVVKNSDENKAENFENIVMETLKELTEKGIDRELIEAAVNNTEFAYREAQFGYPKGLSYNMLIMDSWLYDGEPLSHLKFTAIFEKFRKEASKGYFENFIKKYMINNNHRALVVLTPDPEMLKREEEKNKTQLENIKKNMTEKELDEIIELNSQLKKRQSTPDTEEALRSLPMLSISDIEKEPQKFNITKFKEKEIFHTEENTNSISYINMLVNLEVLNSDELNYVKILSGLLSKISTKSYNYQELSKKIDINTGGVEFMPEIIINYDNDEDYTPYLSIKGKSLREKTPELTSLFTEIMNNTIFDDKNRIKEVLNEIKSRFEMQMMRSGHVFARRRMFSYISQSGYAEEMISGIHAYEFIKNTVKNFDSIYGELVNKLNTVYRKIFNRNNIIVHYTGSKKDFEVCVNDLINVAENLNNDSVSRNKFNFNLEIKNEGLAAPAQIQYVAAGGNFKKAGFDYTGSMKVLKTIVGFDYLWNKVRVQGGAYGAFVDFSNSGKLFMGSYRDPNLTQTLEVFKNTPEYLEKFEADDYSINKYIIGTIGELDPHNPPQRKGELALRYMLSGNTFDKMKKLRQEVLSTKVEDLKKFAGMFEEVMKNNIHVVFGNEDKIKENREIFGEITKVFD
ncbi:MAG: insulinase family protein [Candidatus Muiribacteriota bacterium]